MLYRGNTFSLKQHLKILLKQLFQATHVKLLRVTDHTSHPYGNFRWVIWLVLGSKRETQK